MAGEQQPPPQPTGILGAIAAKLQPVAQAFSDKASFLPTPIDAPRIPEGPAQGQVLGPLKTRMDIAGKNFGAAFAPDIALEQRERFMGNAALLATAAAVRGIKRMAQEQLARYGLWEENQAPVAFASPVTPQEQRVVAGALANPIEHLLDPADLSQFRRSYPVDAQLAERRIDNAARIAQTEQAPGMGNVRELVHDAAGVDPDFMGALIRRESANDPNAQARTSSAGGLTQLLDGTMVRLWRDYGFKYGLDTNAPEGEIIAQKFNPAINALLGAEYAKENAEAFRDAVGREPTHGEVYLMHHFGSGGGIRLANAIARGQANASSLFEPGVVSANHDVFYGAHQQPRSAAGVRDFLTRSFENLPFSGPEE